MSASERARNREKREIEEGREGRRERVCVRESVCERECVCESVCEREKVWLCVCVNVYLQTQSTLAHTEDTNTNNDIERDAAVVDRATLRY